METLCHLTYTTLVPSILEKGLLGMPSRHHRYDDDGNIVAVKWSGDLPADRRPPAIWFMAREDAEFFVYNQLFRHRHDPPGDVRQIVEVDLEGYEVERSGTPFFNVQRVPIYVVLTKRIPPERITVVPRDEDPPSLFGLAVKRARKRLFT